MNLAVSVEGLTLADIRSLLRWMRSRLGPLWMEWQAGSLTSVSGDSLSFRRLLALLDGPQSQFDHTVDIFGSGQSIREIEALFAAYRRLRRAEQRLAAHNGGLTTAWKRKIRERRAAAGRDGAG